MCARPIAESRAGLRIQVVPEFNKDRLFGFIVGSICWIFNSPAWVQGIFLPGLSARSNVAHSIGESALNTGYC